MMLDEITAFLDLPRRVEIMRLLADARTRAAASRSSCRPTIWTSPFAPRTGCGCSGVEASLTGAPEDLVLSGAFDRAFLSGTA